VSDESDRTGLDAVDRAARGDGPIIGIGASAGGIDALKRFFPAVAAEPSC